MEPFQTECTVSGTLRIILFLSFLIGIAPLKFEKVHNGWRIMTSKAANLYGKIIVVCFCILATPNVASTLNGTVKPFHLRTTPELVMAVFILNLSLPVALVASFSAMERMRHMINNLAQLEKINTQLYQINDCKQIVIKEWQTFLCVFCLMIFGYCTNFTEYGLFIYEVAYENGVGYLQSLHIFFYIMIQYVQLISIQFLLITSSVLFSFRLFNNCLEYTLRRICEKNMMNIHRNDKTSETVRRLALMYCSLCDVVQSLNDCNGLLLAHQLLVCLLFLIVTLYHLFLRLFKSKLNQMDTDASELYSGSLQFFWLCIHVSNLVIVVEPCHRTHKQMEETKILVSKLMRHTPPSQQEINSELLLFYRYLMMYDVKYAPLKMFTLNRSLFTTILGSITTYLVVVLAF